MTKEDNGEEYSRRDTDDEGMYLFVCCLIANIFFLLFCFGNIFIILVSYHKLKNNIEDNKDTITYDT